MASSSSERASTASESAGEFVSSLSDAELRVLFEDDPDTFVTLARESGDAYGALNDVLTPAEKRAVCEADFELFLNLVTYNYIDHTAIEWLPVPDHALFWHDQIHSNDLNMILSARKHTKTTWALAEILHKCQFQTGFEVLYWANTEPQVRARMSELDDMIEANSWLDQLQNNGTACGSSRFKEFNNGSKLHTTSVSGAAEGAHVSFSIGDDPLKEFGGVPDEKIVEWYTRVIEPMLNQGGTHVITGTRKRPNDLYALLNEKGDDEDFDLPSYNLVEYPAVREAWLDEYDDRVDDLAPESLYTAVDAPELAKSLDLETDTVHVLWAEGRPVEWLKRQRGGQGRSAFLREFCMVFQEAEGAIIKRESIDEYCSIDATPPESVFIDDESGVRTAPDGRTYDDVVVGVDPASTQGSDDSAFVVLGIRPDELREVLHVYTNQGISPSHFKAKLQELNARYCPSTITIESNGMQQYLVDDAVEFDGSLPIRRHHTTAQKHSWEDGILAFQSRIEAGDYQFYRQANDDTSKLVNELCQLVVEDGKLVGHTPDAVSALYQSTRAIQGGMSTADASLDPATQGDDQDGDARSTPGFRESEIGRAVLDYLETSR